MRKLLVLVVGVLGIACGSTEAAHRSSSPVPATTLPVAATLTIAPVPATTRPAAAMLTIAQGTVGRIGALSIGVISVRDVAGAIEAGLGFADGEAGVTVHVGETIERAGYSIYVTDIRVGSALGGCGAPGCSNGQQVTLVVTPAH